MSTTTLSLIGAILCVYAAVLLYQKNAESRSSRICRLFDLDPQEYSLIGSDLGGSADKLFLRADGVVGAPDAIFRHNESGTIVVGEAKRRRYRGTTSDYELYQVVLYQGLAHRRYRTAVRGLLRYGCGRVVQIDPDGELYRNLIGLLPEYRRVAKSLKIF